MGAQSNPDYRFLDEQYTAARFYTQPLDSLDSELVAGMLGALAERYGHDFHYEVAGHSVQKRPIHLVTLGRGPKKVLLWSQMHGDEPTATGALFDVFNYLMMHRGEPFTQAILDSITIYAVPMLNPDGARQSSRRNAQGLDINRDARDRQTPEGRLLIELKDRLQPDFGFNLHNQNARRTVGDTGRLAAIALMAPPFDAQEADNPVRLRAKQVAVVIYQALGPELSGHISKYDADYMPRAFGDAMQNWGVSTVLIESGGWYTDAGRYLQKLNFIALLAAFSAIGDDSYATADPAIYDALPENGRPIYDLIIRDVQVIDGTGIAPFKADVAVNFDNGRGLIADLGDLDVHEANETVAGERLYLAPGLIGVIRDVDLGAPAALAKKAQKLLEKGFTTLLYVLPGPQLAQFENFRNDAGLPGNTKAVLRLDGPLESANAKLVLLERLATGPVGVLAGQDTAAEKLVTSLTGKPVVPPEEADFTLKLRSLDPQLIQRLTEGQAQQWHLGHSATIKKGKVADFVLFTKGLLGRPKVHAVYVAGRLVWPAGD
ncbi:MAG: hypothetical protein IID13_08225 [Candidatus Marinimicrobia bacterium]|nr:hypothetical protein [Candidatus Neomarinimicrobiota bacterium]